MEINALTIGLAVFATTYLFLRALLSFTQDASEPHALATSIPFISPLIKMAKQSEFYIETWEKLQIPIYTLRLPFSRLYIINSIDLIPAVQRQFKVLSFPAFETKGVGNITGASKPTMDKLAEDRDGIGEFTYAINFDKALHPGLAPGPPLDALNRASVEIIDECLRDLESEAPQQVQLFEWVSKTLSYASTEAVYGPMNPFRDPAVQDAYWNFESGLVVLLFNFFPRLFARKSLQGRETIAKAFETYFRNRGHEEGSKLVQCRWQYSADWNIPVEDIARFEVGGALAVLTNTIPTSFWILFHIFSNPIILDECRNELAKVVDSDGKTNTIDISDVKAKCPILLSTLQEVLRFHGQGTSVRAVQEDHLLAGQYLLKKGSTIMIPAAVQHNARNAWGADVGQFQHRRFLRENGKRVNPVAFRGFGGGTTLCPGRHFVTTEILAFAALMIVRFDVEPVSGKWVTPTTDKAPGHNMVPQPDKDIEVKISRRKACEQQGWTVLLSESESQLVVSAEDMKF